MTVGVVATVSAEAGSFSPSDFALVKSRVFGSTALPTPPELGVTSGTLPRVKFSEEANPPAARTAGGTSNAFVEADVGILIRDGEIEFGGVAADCLDGGGPLYKPGSREDSSESAAGK